MNIYSNPKKSRRWSKWYFCSYLALERGIRNQSEEYIVGRSHSSAMVGISIFYYYFCVNMYSSNNV